MPVALDDVLKDFSEEDRGEIERGGAAIVGENRMLRDLRKAANLTQSELAAAMGSSQPNVAKVERKTDLMVSTVHRVVEALGGTLQLVVHLPGKPPATLDIGAGRQSGPARGRKGTKAPPRPKVA